MLINQKIFYKAGMLAIHKDTVTNSKIFSHSI
jgi:hypothetical protein